MKNSGFVNATALDVLVLLLVVIVLELSDVYITE